MYEYERRAEVVGSERSVRPIIFRPVGVSDSYS